MPTKPKLDLTINVWTLILIIGSIAVSMYKVEQNLERTEALSVNLATIMRENMEMHALFDKRLTIVEHDASMNKLRN